MNLMKYTEKFRLNKNKHAPKKSTRLLIIWVKDIPESIAFYQAPIYQFDK